MNYTLFLIAICSHIFIFTNGLVLGLWIGDRFRYIQNITGTNILNKTHKVKQNNREVSIDDRKIVIGVDTKGLEKKFDDIGDTSVIQNDTINSVSKLKNMKGK